MTQLDERFHADECHLWSSIVSGLLSSLSRRLIGRLNSPLYDPLAEINISI